MLRLLSLLLVPLVYGYVLQDNGCSVTEWSEWGECSVEANCAAPSSHSWPGQRTDPALAAARRTLNMARKILSRAELTACKSAGTCTQMALPDSVYGLKECIGGVANGEWPCDKIDLLAFINLDDLGYDESINTPPEERTGADLWGWTDPDNGDNYAIMATSGGCSFVRVTDPENPVVLAFLETNTRASLWRDVKVLDHYLYTGSEAADHGIQIFDLHQLRAWNDYQGHLNASNSDVIVYSGVGQSHNVVVDPINNYLYVVGSTAGNHTHCDGGLHMVDVTDPNNPTFVGCFADDEYTHDAQCVLYHGPDSRYTGRQICFAYNEDSLTIIDVTDKSAPVMLSRMEYENSRYTHQGWLTENHEVLLLDDELDEFVAAEGDKHTRTFIWDIKDLVIPVLRTVYYSTEQAIDHNQYIVKDLTYQSNYEAGLRILVIDEVNFNLTDKAHFSVWREGDVGGATADFFGTWSNYPYFMTGDEQYPPWLPMSSMDYGLFLVRPRYELFEDWPAGAVQKRSRKHSAGAPGCAPLVEKQECEAEPRC